MKSFKEYLNEKQHTGRMEIGTLKAKEYAPQIRKMGIEVEKADDDGLVVVTKNSSQMKKLHSWMKKNGWDDEDIKAMHA